MSGNPEIIERHHPGIGATLAQLVEDVSAHFPGVMFTVVARDPVSEPGKVGVVTASSDEDMDAVAALIAGIAKFQRGPTQ